MRKRNRLWLLVAMATTGSVVWYLLSTPADSLLAKATRVANVEGWKLSSVVWLDNRTVFALRYDLSGQSGSDSAVRVDARHGVEKPFPGLDAKQVERARRGRSFCVSPDGKWLLCLAKSRGKEAWAAMALDGSGRVTERPLMPPLSSTTEVRFSGSGAARYAEAPRDQAAWLPDSRGWIGIDTTFSVCWGWIHSVDEKTAARSVKIIMPDPPSVGSPPIAYAFMVGPGGPGINNGRSWLGGTNSALGVTLLGVGSTARAIVLGRGLNGPPTPPSLYGIDVLGSGNATPLVAPILPQGARVDQVVLSPQGDKIAWKLFTSRTQATANWLTRIFPFLQRSAPRTTAEIWVSDLNGGMREIGSILVRPAPFVVSRDFPNQMRWTPDGKRISFAYQKTLYTVPLD